MNWEHQAFVGLTPLVGNSGFEYAMPFNFELMKQFSARLSLSIPFCRIDFYEVNGLLFFGEITLYPAAGFGKFYPDEWNYILGNMIDI